MAIDTIEEKLHNGEYTSLAHVESDCKRLVNNAKAFNDKKSLIYEDAERLRKTASNWMVKYNPAYKYSGYVAVATPIPGEEPGPPNRPIQRINLTPRASQANVATPDSQDRPRRAAAAAVPSQPPTPAPSRSRASASKPQSVAEPEQKKDFDEKAFQQAQEQIVKGLIDYVEPE